MRLITLEPVGLLHRLEGDIDRWKEVKCSLPSWPEGFTVYSCCRASMLGSLHEQAPIFPACPIAVRRAKSTLW